MTWTNKDGPARIEREQYFGRYRLSYWPKDPLRSPSMKVRRNCSIDQALRFAKRYAIPSFVEACK